MGVFDLDPCSNERSHVHAHYKFALPQDGLALAKIVPARTRTFINPPYTRGEVTRWIAAYAHTDFTFLLRWDPSTTWFAEMLKHARFAWFPLGERINFEPPPGVKGTSATMPHALYCKRAPNISKGLVVKLGAASAELDLLRSR